MLLGKSAFRFFLKVNNKIHVSLSSGAEIFNHESFEVLYPTTMRTGLFTTRRHCTSVWLILLFFRIGTQTLLICKSCRS